MENIFNFIHSYGDIILFIMAVILVLGAGLLMGWQWVRVKAYALMLLAKRMSKNGALVTGIEQEEWVVNALYIILRKLKIPLSKDIVKKIVSYLYGKAIDWLDDGKINNSIK